MSFLKRQPPGTVATDTIVPLNQLDDNSINRSIIVQLTIRFDDVLDAHRLSSSLERLAEHGEWRKLGARLRLNSAGHLEYHVPVSFGPDRPAFTYSHVSYATSIEDHDIARKLPKPTSRPAIHGAPADFQSLAGHSNGPRTLDDYLHSDRPQLFLHLVSFPDATLVSVTWPHTLCDANGMSSLLRAWSYVIDDQESLVPPLYGFAEDPLAALDTQSKHERYLLADLTLTGLRFFFFAIAYLIEAIWWRHDETHVISLPNANLQAMKREALQDLVDMGHDREDLFLSDGDIISAWLSRLTVQQLYPSTSTKPVNVFNAFNFRRVLQDILPPDKVYLANGSSSVNVTIPACDFYLKPLGYVAWLVRRSIQEQGTNSQVKALLDIYKKSMDQLKRPPIFATWDTKLLIISNWTQAKFFDLDFSPAVTKTGVALRRRSNALGRPSYIHSQGFGGGSSRHAFPIYGKDASGTYWIQAQLRASSWLGFSTAIDEM